MSLLLAGLVAAGAGGAVLVGRWLAKRRESTEGKKETRPETSEVEARASADPTDVIAGFACQLGDVIMRVTGEEAWLAGGLVLSEEVPVAILFVAPEAKQDCAIYARPKPREAIQWLAPLDPAVVLVGGEPPTSVEHEGLRFERSRRLPLRPKRVGVGAPDVGDSVVVAEYESAGNERLLVLKGGAGTRAFRGVELEASSYEVIASGKRTLD